MTIDQVAAQLYTLRDHLKTPRQIASTLRKIRKTGYRAVEIAGTGPVETSELRRILDDEGLLCCSTHENARTIIESPATIAEKLNMLGCTFTAYPYPADVDLSSMRAVKAFARQLNEAGRVLHEAGRVLTYHNHELELFKIKESSLLDVIYRETDPLYLQAELDVHWIQAGGGNPVEWCRKLAGRLPTLHLKDYGVTLQRKRVFAEIGSGHLPWKEIVTAAGESGCSWFIVGQDDNWVDNDPFKSLRESYRFIREKLAA